MGSEITGYDILDRYRNISNKLKKRFLGRKPNLTEGSESFVSLGQQCETEDLYLPSFAGLSWLSAARCEGNLGNNTTETSYLIRSGRQFLAAEENDWKMGCISVPSDNLQAGLASFTHASTRCQDSCRTPLALDLEIIEFLKKIDRHELIETHLQNAIKLSEGTEEAKIHCLDLLATNFIFKGDFLAALKTYIEISNILTTLPENGARIMILLKCEINSVFLLLILRPSPQKLTPSFGKILEKYAWGERNDKMLEACHMSEQIFILLQSLVILCQSFDTSGLLDLENEFWPVLNTEQKDLLRILVRIYCNLT